MANFSRKLKKIWYRPDLIDGCLVKANGSTPPDAERPGHSGAEAEAGS